MTYSVQGEVEREKLIEMAGLSIKVCIPEQRLYLV